MSKPYSSRQIKLEGEMMLKKCLRILFVLSFLGSVPVQAHANDWDTYLEIVNNYYTLNQQDFESVSCHIDVPLINNLLGQMRSQLKQIGANMAITDDLASFSFTYSKQKGLVIHQPSLDVRIISEKGIKDRAKVKKGIDMFKTGFGQTIEGVAQQLEGFFEGFGYEVPRGKDYRIEEIRNDNGIYTVKYEKDHSSFTEIYSGNQRKVTQIGADGAKISSVENYDKTADDKLVLTGAHIVMDQPQLKMEADMTVSYQRVKNLTFPAHIMTRAKQSIQTIKTEGQFDIYLENCTMR
jgi:hypothetical protein